MPYARKPGRIALLLALGGALLGGGGCTPVFPRDADRLSGSLSGLLLEPHITCEQLRETFGLRYAEIVDDPGGLGLDFEEHFLALDDGAAVHMWLIPAKLNRGVVVLSHGNAGAMNCYLFVARLLVRDGWTVAMYDYTGFGHSTGEPDLALLAPSLELVTDFTRTRTGRAQVTLMGVSLGSLPSIAVAAGRPDAVNGVILDSPVALRAQFRRFALLFAFQPDLYLRELDPNLVSDHRIADMQQPLLVFQHGRDIVSTPDSVQELFDDAPGPKQMIRFPDLPHSAGAYYRTSEYIFALDTFLSTVWTQ